MSKRTDMSWSRLESTFQSCSGSAKKTPLKRRSRPTTSSASKKPSIVLKPVARKTPATFSNKPSNNVEVSISTSIKKRLTTNKKQLNFSPHNKENDSSDSISIDNNENINGRCTPPRLASMTVSTNRWISPRRLNFESTLVTTAFTTSTSAQCIENIEEHVEVPETQASDASDMDTTMFRIDDYDTEDIPMAQHQDLSSSASTVTTILDSNASTTPNPTRIASLDSGTPASAPYRLSPPPRRRPRSGGLLEQLNAAVRQTKSEVAFWQHERRIGLVEATGCVVVQVLEVRKTMLSDDIAAAVRYETEAGCYNGGSWIRAQHIHDCSRQSEADDANVAAESTMILILDGDLKLCDRLMVGMRLEVDLRCAVQFMILMKNSGSSSGNCNVPVYPNVHFVREVLPLRRS